MNVRDALRDAQLGIAPFEEQLSDFDYLYAKKPDEIRINLEQYWNIPTIADRSELAEIARKFHVKAGTLTEAVNRNIDILAKNDHCCVWHISQTCWHI